MTENFNPDDLLAHAGAVSIAEDFIEGIKADLTERIVALAQLKMLGLDDAHLIGTMVRDLEGWEHDHLASYLAVLMLDISGTALRGVASEKNDEGSEPA